MKNKIIILIAALLTFHNSFSQSRLIINGGIISIKDNAFLIIDNPDANSIQHYGGYIASEGENNRIKWNVGNNIGTYTVPFGYNGAYLPLTFSKSSGTGSGVFIFSTYHTGWRNSDLLPTGVTNFAGQMPDHSAFAIDRFWQVNPEGYTTNPSMANVTFTYTDAEHQIPSNTISENNLKAQQWNSVTSSWDRAQAGTVTNTSSNTVTVPTVDASSFYQWWTLADSVYPLPIKLLSFSAAAVDKNVFVTWRTSSEEAGTTFVIERSKGGSVFEEVTTIISSVNGSNTYNHTDDRAYPGISWYRIKIVEPSGSATYSPIRRVSIDESVTEVTIYPNPIPDRQCIIQFNKIPQQKVQLIIIDTKGTIVTIRTVPAGVFQFNLRLPKNLPAGVYICHIKFDGAHIQKEIIVY